MAELEEYVIRTASVFDLDIIGTLFNNDYTSHFGEKLDAPLSQLFVEYQTHRFVVFEEKSPKVLLAYCEFCIYPNIPVLSNDFWPQWLKCRFCIDVPLSLMNTMFFNYYIYVREHVEILKQVIMEVFYCEHKINYLIIARPPNYSAKEYDLLEDFGKVYYPNTFNMYGCRNLPTIIVISRNDFMPVINFRKALPEDNDDVIEMIDVEEPHMRKQYGDYYIAEILLGTSGGNMENDKIIVTEDSGPSAIGSTGMMWLTDDTDIEQLIKNFDLESLGNLVTCTPDAPHATVQFEVFTADQRQYFNLKKKTYFGKREMVQLKGSNEEPDRECLNTQELYTKFNFIRYELHNSSNYLDKRLKTLKVSYDIPARLPKFKKYTLKNASRAFVLKNFILHPSLRLEYTYYYLCAMFSAYPDRDYCLVPIPPGAKYSVSLWALLKYFIRVQHRPSCNVSDDVFVAHRSSIYTELSIFRLVKEDLDDIYSLFTSGSKIKPEPGDRRSFRQSHGRMKKSIQLKIIKQICSDVLYNQMSEFSFWVIRCGHTNRANTTAVGFAILRPFSDYEAVYKQFLLPHDEGFLTFDRGELVMLCLHPYFHMWSDEVLRTVAVRSGFRDIFYFQEIKGDAMTNDLASKMMPVEPRRMRRNWFIDTRAKECYRRASDQVDLSKINCVMDEFYLFRHNLFPSKYMGNKNSLVIIGFSDICKAFLRLMVFSWNTPDYKYVSVSNCLPLLDITVIVGHGEVEAEYDQTVQCEYCVTPNECYLHSANTCPFVMDTTQRLDMRNYINFVPGEVESIKRQEKYIALESYCKVFYDKLLLLCDTKFGFPVQSGGTGGTGLPENYMTINRRLDKIELYHKLMEFNKTNLQDKCIIVYGHNLAVYECIDFLLRHGCLSSQIVFVEPHKMVQPEYINNPTCDSNLENILMDMVIDLGVTVHESANFEKFHCYATANFIEKVEFKRFPSKSQLLVPCHLFINFTENFLPVAFERVLEGSNIQLHDRKIVIDEDYRTNDDSIYAAGNSVVYLWNIFHQYIYTSEREMAQKLMDILKLGKETLTREKKFSKPCLFHAQLPENHKIIKVTIPKRYLLATLPNEYSHFMCTYDGDFCRVRLNRKLFVEEIVCVTRKLSRPLFFLEFFCGRHVTLLNNVHNRWKAGLIKSFINFFQEPWTEYIMHDRFDELQMKNHDTLKSLYQHIASRALGMNIGDSDFSEAGKHFLEANLLKFLREFREEFVNQFALPEDWTS
ncbi:PREDICTED: cilia- and flagella-associated protein 61 [Drosophila arizonae]|uniref:Cilia- and flagella-associated protein 61 n=1 Tax=Drosophila arizonae TaxID=7263 RepID=A0ABM1PNQ8_DROAR|nr:PREDICTED: cilia- and flagella-associated protein 61 [Drosophila arizonae]